MGQETKTSCINAIDQVLKIEFPLNDKDKLESISKGFAEFTHYHVFGVVMAMDGIVIKLECLPKTKLQINFLFEIGKIVGG